MCNLNHHVALLRATAGLVKSVSTDSIYNDAEISCFPRCIKSTAHTLAGWMGPAYLSLAHFSLRQEGKETFEDDDTVKDECTGTVRRNPDSYELKDRAKLVLSSRLKNGPLKGSCVLFASRGRYYETPFLTFTNAHTCNGSLFFYDTVDNTTRRSRRRPATATTARCRGSETLGVGVIVEGFTLHPVGTIRSISVAIRFPNIVHAAFAVSIPKFINIVAC